MEKLKMFGIALVTIGVVITVGLKITSDVKSEMVLDRSTNGETFDQSTDPYNYTVAEASDSDFNKLTSVTVYESTSQSTELTYEIVDAEAGKVEISGATDADDESINYEYEDKDTESRTGASDAISGLTELSGFLPIIGLVVSAAIVISLVSSGFGSSGRRGRA